MDRDIIEASRLRLKRRLAAVLLSAIAEAGISFADMDARLGHARPWARRALLALIDGKLNSLNAISDLCVAMGVELEFRLRELPRPTASPGTDAGSSGTELKTDESE